MNTTDEIAETDPALIAPAIARACGRCHDRKVKCDLQIPQCGSCQRQQVTCDITDRVAYSYAVVQSLHEKIQRLEARLRLSQADPRQHLSEPTGDFQNEVHLHQTVDSEDDVDNVQAFAEEVGNLVVGGVDTPWMQYVGSASGTTFSKTFFHQIQAPLLDEIVSQSFGSEQPGFIYDPLTNIQAGLPNRRTAEYLLARFVGRIHVYWPILHLPSLRGWFADAYAMPRDLSSSQKCIIFLVLAIGAHASTDDPPYKKLLDVNTPSEYLSTAFRYYERVSDTPNLQALQILNLLSLCMAFSGDVRHNSSLWQISRYAMSIAIQLGCHRNNPRWRLSAYEVEMRNRVWWCTYAFERMIAVATGRILSIRNHAIDAPFPQITDEDKLTDAEAVVSPTLNLKSVMPAVHVFRLRRIAGDILESVYIARPKHGVSLSRHTVRNMAENLSQSLQRWHLELHDYVLPDSNEYLELQIEYGLACLLLKRPSPTFPNPTLIAIESCADASRMVLESWAELEARNERIETWLTFHDVLLTGMTWLYSRWSSQADDHSTTEHVAQICSRLLTSVSQGEQRLAKYFRFFNRLIEVVLAHCYENERMYRPGLAGSDGPDGELDLNWTDLNFDQIFTEMDLGSQVDMAMDAWSSSLFVPE